MPNAPTPDAVARVVRWAILLFLGYALLHGYLNFGSKPQPPKIPSQFSAQPDKDVEKDCSNAQSPLTDFSMFAFIPSYMPALHVHDTVEGKGQGAFCGQHATLRYEYADKNGDVIFSDLGDNTKPRDIRIGAGSMLPGFEIGLIGMKPGAERTIVIPPELAFADIEDAHSLADYRHFVFPHNQTASNTPIVATAKLLSLSPAIPSSGMPMRIINLKIGRSTMAQCGDTVQVYMTLWKTDGTQVYSSASTKPLVFRLGSATVPFGIDQTVLSMLEGGVRTAILPPRYLQPLDAASDSAANTDSEDADTSKQTPEGEFPAISFPKNETLLAEIALVHVGEEQPSSAPPHPSPTAMPPENTEKH
jgi:FKBP-type peptidyl-prolyl cis-trans isomerase 2